MVALTNPTAVSRMFESAEFQHLTDSEVARIKVWVQSP